MIQLWLKISYTLFVCFLVPVYLQQHGLAHFLWFSDIALLMMVPAIWTENRLLTSMMAIAVFLPELVWNIDFLFQSIIGTALIGFTGYMFDPGVSLIIRGLSLFHSVLPLLFIWMLSRIGYDRRAMLWQTIFAMTVLPCSYLASNPSENINLVYGFGVTPQSKVPAPVFLLFLMLILPIVIYLPTHLAFIKLFGKGRSK